MDVTTSAPLGPATRPARVALAVLPPLGALLLARVLLLVAARGVRVDALRAEVWARWDAAHYLSIAQHGYVFVPCSAAWGGPGNWCGNAGWMPGYPALLAGPLAAGAPGPRVGVLLSAAFAAGLLLLLWTRLLRQQPRRLPLLLLAALFPGQVYQHAVFPISTCLFFALLCLAMQEERRTALAGLAGAAAAFSYTTGFLLAPVTLLAELLAPASTRGPFWERLRRGLGVSLGVGLGYVAALGVFQAQTGHWNALFLTLAKYGVGLHAPWETLADTVAPLLRGGALPRDAAARVQTAFVAVLVVGVVLGALARWRSTGLRERWLVLYGLAYWSFPLVMGGGVSLYRAEALLAPLVLLVRGPAPAGLLLAGAAALVLPMGRLFFLNILV